MMKKTKLVIAGFVLSAFAGAAIAQSIQRINGLVAAAVLPNFLAGSEAVAVDTGDPTNFAKQINVKQFIATNYAYTDTVPTTGFSITIADSIETLSLRPAGALATGTITFPTVPYDRWRITITSTQAVAAITLAGATINGAITSLSANTPVTYKYLAACTCYVKVAD